MKNTRRLILITFVLTLAVFGVFVGRKYMGRDYEGPVIACDQDTITASIQDPDEVLLKGVTAIDNKDGDVSDSLIIESVRMTEGKKCTVSYAAFDNSDNVSKTSRIVEYEDYRSPHFTLTKPLRFVLGSKSEILKSFRANDCIDGDITNRLKLVDMEKDSSYTGEGIYNYEIQVTNSIGDTAVLPVSVEFYADTYEERLFHPNIYLKSYILYLEKGSRFEPRDYLDSVEIGNELYVFDENIRSGQDTEDGQEDGAQRRTSDGRQITGVISYEDVMYQSSVDTGESGVYTVEYSCNTKDNYMGTTQMIVVVE